ncbi:MAG: polysaccharide biosynthesis tyrosine autokinase [Pseudomonadota bacterium]|nr:polysaccharide biosynthesis tyrosine autokinase [Pseudomonadota bacterium]
MNRMLKVGQRLLSDEVSPRTVGLLAAEPRNFYLRVLRHQLPTVIMFMVLTMALALIYLFVTVPTYIATAYMVIDTHKEQLLDPQEALRNAVTVDTGMVETQIELLKSQNVSRAVIKKLHLTEDPEYAGDPPGFILDLVNRVVGLFTPSTEPLTEEEAKAQLLRKVQATFEDKRTVTRVQQSYVNEIDIQSVDRVKAARIANAIAEAYIDDALEAKYEETRRASVWLQDRLKELRAEISAQQQAVVTFRQKNNISYVDTTGGKFYIDTPGKLVNEQQLSELNSQLILAQASTAEEKARYDRIQEVMKQDVPDASIADALNNQVIVKLRGEYLDMATRVAIWSQKYGSSHLSVVAQRTQMREIKLAIKDEMGKIEQSYKSNYEIALAREQSLRGSLNNSMSQSQITNQAQIQLQELESKAQTSRTLHDSFLQHYMEQVQQQSFPITEARLVGPADAPVSKSYPKTWLVLLLAAAGGAALSFGIAALRETLDRVFRSSEQIEEELQVNSLAMVPLLKPAAGSNADGTDVAEAPPLSPASPLLMRSQPMLDIVLDKPFSQFSEALRTVKVASDLNAILKSKKVTGIISTLPGEGKSTISANYAQIIAHGGSRAILIDADLRNPILSFLLGYEGPGLIDVLAGWKSVDEALLLDPRSGLRFLPAGPKSNMPHTNELLASEAMKKLIASLQETYDYVIVDLPPLIPVVDARASTNFIDSYIYVVEWGSTKIDLVRHGLLSAPELYERLLGVILNKVDMSAVGRYERYRNNYYYDKYRSQYSYSDGSGSVTARNTIGAPR